MYEYAATLIRVVDADTFDMNIDLGFYTHVYDRVRLFGVNAPERFTPEGRIATAFVKSWFSLNPIFVLRTHKGDLTDKYGRWVAEVVTREGISLSAAMIEEGLGVPFIP